MGSPDHPPGAPQTSVAHRKVALVIEDQILIAFHIEDELRIMGFAQILKAETFAEAMFALETMTPSLIVSDCRIGAETADTVALRTLDQGIPLLLIAADVENVRGSQMFRHAIVIPKPYVPAELRCAVGKLTGP